MLTNINVINRRASVFHRRRELCNLNLASLYEKLSSRCSNQAGKIKLAASQITWCPALYQTPVTAWLQITNLNSWQLCKPQWMITNYHMHILCIDVRSTYMCWVCIFFSFSFFFHRHWYRTWKSANQSLKCRKR